MSELQRPARVASAVPGRRRARLTLTVEAPLTVACTRVRRGAAEVGAPVAAGREHRILGAETMD